MQAVTLSVFRFGSVIDRLWVFSQMQFARAPLARDREVSFFKLFGSGTGEGFTPIPNFGVYAILIAWSSLEAAQCGLRDNAVLRRWRGRSVEAASLTLCATASRGVWDGKPPFHVEPMQQAPSPMAVLTRATIKKRHVLAFWRKQPAVSGMIRDQTALRFKIGLGEVPWFQQVTFSVWDNASAMQAFAYQGAAHRAAIDGVRAGGWFHEELYARFRVLAAEGTWEGRHVLEESGKQGASLVGNLPRDRKEPPAIVAINPEDHHA